MPQEIQNAVVRSLVLDADREAVWKAISSDDGLAGWLAESATRRPAARRAGRRPLRRRARAPPARRRGRGRHVDRVRLVACSRAGCARRASSSGSRMPGTARRGSPSARRGSRRPTDAAPGRLAAAAWAWEAVLDGARRAGRARRRGVGAWRIPTPSSRRSPTRRAGASTGRSPVGGADTASDLARQLPISRQAVSKHLAALADAGLVASRAQRARDALPADARAARRRSPPGCPRSARSGMPGWPRWPTLVERRTAAWLLQEPEGERGEDVDRHELEPLDPRRLAVEPSRTPP